jgi:mannose-6-phosphate isomerase-like protein (cupin superfamily)
MIDRKGKVWGTTSLIHASRYVQAHLLEIRAGGFCSEHRHERKTNTFIVLRGRLEVRTWPDMTNAFDATELEAGQSMAVPVGVYHQFRAIDDTLCIEFYEAAEIEEDIHRRTQGGAPS